MPADAKEDWLGMEHKIVSLITTEISLPKSLTERAHHTQQPSTGKPCTIMVRLSTTRTRTMSSSKLDNLAHETLFIRTSQTESPKKKTGAIPQNAGGHTSRI